MALPLQNLYNNMEQKTFKVGIIGATGMVGQRFILQLQNHPWFQIALLCASPKNAGKRYADVMQNRWAMKSPIPQSVQAMLLHSTEDIATIKIHVDFVFCAVDMPKKEIIALEEALAKAEIPVVSNNSANRMQSDVPMLIPECNASHCEVIPSQKKRLGTEKGFIAVKPNCSIQSYVPAIVPLLAFEPALLHVCTYQAISGAGKTFETWPEMLDNVIPYIGGEDEKSEIEPQKVLGKVKNGKIELSQDLTISAQCIRVPVSDGHLAAVSVKFRKKPSRAQILDAWQNYTSTAQHLPSAPKPFLQYFEEENRPQTKLDRMQQNGMGISLGRLREDPIWDYKFVCLSHNTLRGAAGGAILMAELLVQEGYIK